MAHLSKRTIAPCVLIIIISVVIIGVLIDVTEAKRFGGSFGRSYGGSRSRGGSSSRGGSGRGSGSSSHPSPPVHRPSAPSAPSHPPVRPPSAPSVPSHPPVRPPSAPSVPSHPPVRPPSAPSVPSHPPVRPPSAPSAPPHPSNPKDSSSILIHNEGGGRPRPSTGIANDAHQTSQSTGQTINKVNVPPSQTAPQGSTSNNYPPWANPAVKPAGSAPYPNSNPNGSPTHTNSNPIGAPYPTHPNSNPIGAPHPQPGSSAPYPGSHPMGIPHPSPNSPSSAPYPNSHPVGMPKPVGTPGSSSNPIGQPHHAPTLGNTPTGHIPPPVHGPPPVYGAPSGTHGGYGPPPVYGAPPGSHGGYGSPPSYGAPPGMPHGGYGAPPYSGYPSGGYHPPSYGPPPNYNQATGMGQPVYTPTFSGPSSQPFVPGQSVIVLPGESRGPGFGDMLKQAVVFSSVNALVNRVVNGPSGHTHYVSQSHPLGSSSTVTNNTTIITNNYGSPNPSDPSSPPSYNPQPNVPNTPIGAPPSYVPNNNYNPGSSSNYPSTPNPPNSGNTYVPNTNNGVPNNANTYPNTNFPVSGPNAANNNLTDQSSGYFVNKNEQPAGNSTATGNSTPAPTAEAVMNYYIPESELLNLTETLFAKNEMNVRSIYALDLQKKVSNVSDVKDESERPLFWVSQEAYGIPTIAAFRDVYDNFQFNSTKKENVTSSSRKKESLLLDTVLNTDVMAKAIKWLQEKSYIEPDDFEVKDTLRHIWFGRIDGYSTGFERIFMAEWYPGPVILGAQNWVYFDSQQYQKKLNYLSYVEKVDIKNDISLLKLNVEVGGVVKPNVTMLIGTPPELEMALYTVCFYVRPNDLCPISLGGKLITLYTHSFRYFGKDLIDLGLIVY